MIEFTEFGLPDLVLIQTNPTPRSITRKIQGRSTSGARQGDLDGLWVVLIMIGVTGLVLAAVSNSRQVFIRVAQ